MCSLDGFGCLMDQGSASSNPADDHSYAPPYNRATNRKLEFQAMVYGDPLRRSSFASCQLQNDMVQVPLLQNG